MKTIQLSDKLATKLLSDTVERVDKLPWSEADKLRPLVQALRRSGVTSSNDWMSDHYCLGRKGFRNKGSRVIAVGRA